jgi:hypothetical protein
MSIINCGAGTNAKRTAANGESMKSMKHGRGSNYRVLVAPLHAALPLGLMVNTPTSRTFLTSQMTVTTICT